MTMSRERPPFVADERALLVGWLDQQRALVRWKCEGLAEADEQRVVLPTSPLMTVAGLVSHLRWTEHCWFFTAAQATLRWMLLHMLEETARHIGHLDTIRELLDNKKGYY